MANQAPVALVMGSDSDLPKLENTLAVLEELKIPLEVRVISAHRTPDELREWLDVAVPGGLNVIIAAAGMAAHLAGACAAHTTIPVIGIPVVGGALSGLDALLSTVNMPGRRTGCDGGPGQRGGEERGAARCSDSRRGGIRRSPNGWPRCAWPTAMRCGPRTRRFGRSIQGSRRWGLRIGDHREPWFIVSRKTRPQPDRIKADSGANFSSFFAPTTSSLQNREASRTTLHLIENEG